MKYFVNILSPQPSIEYRSRWELERKSECVCRDDAIQIYRQWSSESSSAPSGCIVEIRAVSGYHPAVFSVGQSVVWEMFGVVVGDGTITMLGRSACDQCQDFCIIDGHYDPRVDDVKTGDSYFRNQLMLSQVFSSDNPVNPTKQSRVQIQLRDILDPALTKHQYRDYLHPEFNYDRSWKWVESQVRKEIEAYYDYLFPLRHELRIVLMEPRLQNTDRTSYYREEYNRKYNIRQCDM